MSDKNAVMKTTHQNLVQLIESKKDAMPKGFNETRFIQNCMTVLQDTKGIEKCQPLSVARTLLKGAFLGLDFFQKECYAIPYGNSLQFQTDYKGETKMAKKYSIRPIKDIYAKIVRVGDDFQEEIVQGQQIINFKPLPFNDGEIIGAFAVVLYEDGGMEYDAMSKKEIENIRENFSKMKNGLMWTKTPGEAYKKTVLRRLTKKIEKDFETTEQAAEYALASDSEFKKENVREEVPSTFNKEAETVEYEEVKEEPTETPKDDTDYTGTPYDTEDK